MRVRLELSYNGTSFEGWQIQKRGRTVQGVLEETLGKIEKRSVRLTGAGRTDSGVHARAQVAHFDTTLTSMAPEKFLPAVNRLLPRDIRIISSRQADPEFHARYDALARTYRYFLYRGEEASPFQGPFRYARRHLPNLHQLNRAASSLLGSHDFSAFAAAGDISNSKVRTIYQAAFLESSGMVEFRITGNAFLWRMVRSIVGTILENCQGEDPWEDMKIILESRERERAGTTAPPSGLFFWKAHYDRENLYG